MSSNSTNTGFPSGLSIQGGIPLKSQDLAASIIFLIVYALIAPLAIFRSVRPASRCWTLLRPTIFIFARLAAFVIRAIQANGNYNTGLFVGEQILLLSGFILLCEPVLSLLRYHINRNAVPSPNSSHVFTNILRLLDLALIAALGLGAYAGSQMASVQSDPDKLDTVKTLRNANAIICAVITAFVVILSIASAVRSHLPVPQTLFLVITGSLLTCSSIYKLVIYEASTPPNMYASGTKAAFYLLAMLPEAIVTAMLFAVNLKTFFNMVEVDKVHKIEKQMKKGTYQETGSESTAEWKQPEYPPPARGSNFV